MVRRAGPRVLITALSFLTVACGVSPREFEQIKQYLYCVDCDEGERDSVKAIGWRAKPLLRETLKGLPPGRAENLIRRYRLIQERIVGYGVDTTGFVTFHLGNKTAVVQLRSAISLADLKDWKTLRMALDSSDAWGYRREVISGIQDLLFDDAITFRRYSDGVITGTVRRSSSGTAVGDLWIYHRRCLHAPGVDRDGRAGQCADPGPTQDSVRTDVDGEYQFNGLEEGVHEIVVSRTLGSQTFPHSHPSKGLALLVGKADTGVVDFRVGLLNTIQGRVSAQDGTPASRGRVRIFTNRGQPGNPRYPPGTTPRPPVTSAIDTVIQLSDWGAFSVAGVPEGLFDLVPEAPDGLPWVPFPGGPHTVDTRGQNDLFEVDLRMGYRGWIEGVVGRDTDGDGEVDHSLPGLRITLSGLSNASTETDNDGGFSFQRVEGGPYEISIQGLPPHLTSISSAGIPSQRVSVVIPARSPHVQPGVPRWDFDRDRVTHAGPADFLLLTKSTILGGGVFENWDPNRPMPGIPVILSRCEKSAGVIVPARGFPGRCSSYSYDFPQYPDTVVSNEKGNYRFGEVVEGIYEVRVDLSGDDYTFEIPSYLVLVRMPPEVEVSAIGRSEEDSDFRIQVVEIDFGSR